MSKNYKHGDEIAPIEFENPLAPHPTNWCEGCAKPIPFLAWAVFHYDHGPVPQYLQDALAADAA
jgi:hypothetical protein